MNQQTPSLFRNRISLIGAALSLISLVNITFLFLIDILGGRTKPYVGIFTYIVFPLFLILGLIIVFIGIILERRKRRRLAPSEIPPYPRIDLNNPRHRRVFAFLIVFAFFILPLSTFGSYRAFELTDSVSFCGLLCHKVMEPEYTAYQISPHARVRCVECHVGTGAGPHVRAKLSGAAKGYAVLFNKYSRPIPAPTDSLQPSQNTCEQCHWPEKFFGTQLKVFTHFAYDEENTPRQIKMLIKTGGGSPTTGLTMGIHWHMNLSNEVWYITTDDKRQVIPWVRTKDKEGRVTEYLLKDSPLTQAEVEKAYKRQMDCMDCHNRSAHTYLPPDRLVDEALLAGRLDPSIPYIKQQTVEALAQSYSSTEEATEKIAANLTAFYSAKYPDLYAKRQDAIKNTVAEVQRIFKTNFFPRMKVDWQTYPDNIGHFYSGGCFRCHDGQHVSRDGKTIRRDCEICHTVLSQEVGKAPMVTLGGTSFQHPIEIGELGDISCSDCHKGGSMGP